MTSFNEQNEFRINEVLERHKQWLGIDCSWNLSFDRNNEIWSV